MKVKFVYLFIGFLFLFGFLAGVEASTTPFSLCLRPGEKVRFSQCNSAMLDRTCTATTGCNYCVHLKSPGVYCPSSINVCNSQSPDCTYLTNSTSPPPAINVTNNTTNSTSNSTIPVQKQTIIVFSPLQLDAFSTTVIPLDIKTTSPTILRYIVTNQPGAVWKQLCANCNFYKGNQKFKEGLNNLTISATNSTGGIVLISRSFYVDSKVPKILKADPTKGFANGTFTVQFEEQNPKLLKLYYGNSAKGMKQQQVNLTKCILIKTKYTCSTQVSLNNYTGQTIHFWFELGDVANSKTSSKILTLPVDTTVPDLKNITCTLKQKTATCLFTIQESNFASLSYINHADRVPKEKQLCAKINSNLCSAKFTLVTGKNVIDFKVLDKAGNQVVKNKTITI